MDMLLSSRNHCCVYSVASSDKFRYLLYMEDEEIQKKIVEMTKILADNLAPMRIILFGSRARGNARSDSDIDFLLVMENGTHRRKAAVRAYQLLGARGIAKDIVVVTEEDVEKFGSLPGTVIAPAISEGKVVYERAA